MAGVLGLKAFSAGIDRIPEGPLDYVPPFRPPKDRREQKKQERRQEREQRRQRHASGPHQDYPEYPEQQSPPPQVYDYSGAGQYRQDPFAQDDHVDRQSQPRTQQQAYTTSYNPRGPYHSPERQASAEQAPMTSDQYYPPPRDEYYEPRRSYNPANYQPRDDYYGGSASSGGYGRDQYMTPARSEYGRPPMGRHPGDSYDDDWEYGNRERHSRRSRRDRTPSRSRSRSAPRSKSGIRHKVKENFDGTERGLASGAVGAIAGGFVGHQVGKGPLATVAGVLLGGLGANAWEAREARQKDRRQLEVPHSRRRARSNDPDAYPQSSSSRRELEPYYGSRDVSRDEQSGDDEYEERRRAKAKRRAERKKREAEEEEKKLVEKAHKWSHILHS